MESEGKKKELTLLTRGSYPVMEAFTNTANTYNIRRDPTEGITQCSKQVGYDATTHNKTHVYFV